MPPFRAIQQKLRFSSDQILLSVGKTLAISVLILYMLFIFFSNSKPCEISPSLKQIEKSQKANNNNNDDDDINKIKNTPTNISNIVFGISGSTNAWKSRRSYIESWWVPNVTRGYIFFDKPPNKDILPWPTTSPPFRVSENASKFEVYKRHVKPFVIRIVRAVLETFREGNHENVRWFVMGDDDTIFFLENLVSVLGKYDHKKYYYIGGVSECTKSNFDFSFEMAYGGGGFALSYPLAAALVKNLDTCIDRYPYLHVSDQITQYCIADLGVTLTPEKGFHQIDLVHDISGLLSAHPQAPLVTLHHLDIVLPIFPTLGRHASLNQLMKAANVDQPRTLQQTICYDKKKRWSFSVSWGYSAHIYEQVIPRSILKKPLETFTPWSLKPNPPDYMFNTRFLSRHPCDAPHIFFFKSIAKNVTSRRVVTTYVRSLPRGLPPCIPGGNFSADHISRVIVYSPTTKLSEAENRGECCDVVHGGQRNTTAVKFRACGKDEMVA